MHRDCDEQIAALELQTTSGLAHLVKSKSLQSAHQLLRFENWNFSNRVYLEVNSQREKVEQIGWPRNSRVFSLGTGRRCGIPPSKQVSR